MLTLWLDQKRMSIAPVQIEFENVLAITVHDMKNSLSLLLQSLEDLVGLIPEENRQALDIISRVHYETTRLNVNLVQVLTLYKSNAKEVALNIDACFLADLFENIIFSTALFRRHNNIEVATEVDDDLVVYADNDLLYLLINDTVINALKYGASRILIKGIETAEGVTISVEDDGPGYPQHMLCGHDSSAPVLQMQEGRTGLGIYFAQLIVNAHQSNNRKGAIVLENGGRYGGSVFTVKLP